MSEGRRSLLVFVGCCVASLFTLCIWSVIQFFFDLGTPPGQVKASDVWLWVFVFPAAATKDLNWTVANVLMLLNPLIYGGIWWFAWRMWTLMRRRSE